MDKKKVLKIILVIALLLVIIFAIHFIRNYIILGKIMEKQEKLASATNFSYIVEDQTYADEIRIRKIYSTAANSYMINETEDGIWAFWDDKDTNEVIIITPENKAILFNPGNPLELALPTLYIDNDFKALTALTSFISYGKVDGERCYVVNFGDLKNYISVESGITLKSINNGTIISNGKEYGIIQVFKNIKIDEVKENHVARPDLSNYEIVGV